MIEKDLTRIADALEKVCSILNRMAVAFEDSLEEVELAEEEPIEKEDEVDVDEDDEVEEVEDIQEEVKKKEQAVAKKKAANKRMTDRQNVMEELAKLDVKFDKKANTARLKKILEDALATIEEEKAMVPPEPKAEKVEKVAETPKPKAEKVEKVDEKRITREKAEEKPTISIDDLRKALAGFLKIYPKQLAIDLLGEFKASKLSDLKEEQYNRVAERIALEASRQEELKKQEDITM